MLEKREAQAAKAHCSISIVFDWLNGKITTDLKYFCKLLKTKKRKIDEINEMENFQLNQIFLLQIVIYRCKIFLYLG